jgi:hypothetical protein
MLLRTLPGVEWVIAGKLLAAKTTAPGSHSRQQGPKPDSATYFAVLGLGVGRTASSAELEAKFAYLWSDAGTAPRLIS